MEKKSEVIIAIIGYDKNSWYKELIGNRMKAIVTNYNRKALSCSLQEFVEAQHYKIIKGRDVREH